VRIPKRTRTLLIISAVTVILGIGAFTCVIGPIDHVPRLYAFAKSPDGTLIVRVLKKRLSLWPNVRMGILVRISNRQDEVLYERIIFEDSWWDYDIGEMYKQIVFDQDEIRIGPKFTPDDYFVVKKSELRSNTP